MYDVFYLDRFVGSFDSRDEAYEWIQDQPEYSFGVFEDISFEIRESNS